MKRKFLLFVVLSLTYTLTWASTALLDEQVQSIDLSSYTEVYIDTDDRSVTQIQKMNDWSSAGVQGANLGLRSHQHWVRFSLTNQSSKALQFLLELDSAMINRPQLFAHQKGGDWGAVHLGTIPLEELSLAAHNNPLLELDVPGGSTQEYLLNFQDQGTLPVPLLLWSTQGFARHSLHRISYMGLVFGVLIVVGVYNLFLWTVSKEPVFFAFLLFVLSFFCLIFTWNGTGQVLWYPDVSSQLVSRLVLVFLAATWFWFSRFSQIYLHTAYSAPFQDRIFSWLSGLSFGLALFSLAPWSVLNSGLLGGLGLVLFLLSGVAGSTAFRHSRRVAFYYFIAWLVVAGAIFWFSLVFFGLIQQSLLTEMIVLFGCCFGILVFSLGLADRYHHQKNRAEKLQKLQIQQISTDRLALESALNERTKKLKSEQEGKEKLFGIIAHDLRGPMGSLALTLESLRDGLFEWDQKGVEVCARNARKLLEKLESLLLWSESQQGKLVPHPRDVEVVELLFEPCIKFLESVAASKNIRLVIDSDGPFWAKVDPDMIETVLINLVSNAIKFSKPDTQIELSAIEAGNHVVITVKDQGIGVSEQQIEQILSPGGGSYSTQGTHNERGNGLGLTLCNQFVSQNGGTLSIKSVVNLGSEMALRLPLGRRPSELVGLKTLVAGNQERYPNIE